MTKPVYEPSLERTDARLGFSANQLFRRPAPEVESSGTTSAFFDTWLFNGTGASIPDDTWSPVVTGVDGTNDRWFDQACEDPGGNWIPVFTNGRMRNNGSPSHNFSAWGYVIFDVPDGTTIGAQLDWVGGELQVNTGIAVDGMARIEVYSERTPITSAGTSLHCYQASGGAADLLEARLHMRRFETFGGVYECSNAT